MTVCTMNDASNCTCRISCLCTNPNFVPKWRTPPPAHFSEQWIIDCEWKYLNKCMILTMSNLDYPFQCLSTCARIVHLCTRALWTKLLSSNKNYKNYVMKPWTVENPNPNSLNAYIWNHESIIGDRSSIVEIYEKVIFGQKYHD